METSESIGGVPFTKLKKAAYLRRYTLAAVEVPLRRRCQYAFADGTHPAFCDRAVEKGSECVGCGRRMCEVHVSDETLYVQAEGGYGPSALCLDCAKLPQEDVVQLRALRRRLNDHEGGGVC